MTTRAYYSENDKFAAAWLRELIKANLIAPGDVDERDVRDVLPSDLIPYTQHHFFAGIGVWSYALRLAGWPDDRPVWTGSCPCQPYSKAGPQAGNTDERNLWPSWFHLIEGYGPSVIFGEQVEVAVKHGWLDTLQDDLEKNDYSVGACVFPAASVGAPHIRQRLYFAAEKRLSHSVGERLEGLSRHGVSLSESRWIQTHTTRSRATDRILGGWLDQQWLDFKDGKQRPIQPGSFPLVDGPAARVGRLRGYGNAIVAQQAAAFIRSFMEVHT